MTITGKTLIDWGFSPGRWFPSAIEVAQAMQARGEADGAIVAALRVLEPVRVHVAGKPLPYGVFLDAETELERANKAAVLAHMDELMRLPTVVGGAVMPDACPSGVAIGTIPVGGAVATEDAIHPGFHSADVCCSVAISVFTDHDERALLDVVQEVTHFGPGGRDRTVPLPADLGKGIAGNPFLADFGSIATNHFATQGDGNHFAFVGRLKSNGALALVTHHGSRGLGARLYKRGLMAAQKATSKIARGIGGQNAWLKASTREGEDYWRALQIVRRWTKASHFAIHDLAAERLSIGVRDRFWNEHNFVFQKADGRFYHGKGATPSWAGFSPDDDGRTLIPLNMREPILIATHRDHPASLGFAPHGAGRNASRTAFLRASGAAVAAELEVLRTAGLDIRSFCGVPDLSELPSAYKSAAAVLDQIEKYDLAQVVDGVLPYGCIMAGDWQRNAPWRLARAGAAS